MTDLQEKAIRMALKFCDDIGDLNGPYPYVNETAIVSDSRKILQTLRQALAQEQEPVAWMHNFIEGNVITHKPSDIGRYPDRWTALYKDSTPCKTCQALAMAVMTDQTYHEKVVPKRWVGLTKSDIKEGADLSRLYQDQFEPVARWAESKLKEKNHGAI